jgi:hypothetical protein
MASYQNIDSRLKQIERKVDFIMKLGSVTKRQPSTLMPGEFIVSQHSMLDVFREIEALGATIEEENGTV